MGEERKMYCMIEREKIKKGARERNGDTNRRILTASVVTVLVCSYGWTKSWPLVIPFRTPNWSSLPQTINKGDRGWTN